MILDLRAAVRELYGVSPAQFVARRTELAAEARSHGEKDLAADIVALRKPTVAAWAVNALVRTRREAVDEFREFAQLMREAQRTLDAEQLRALGRERSRRVDVLAAVAAEVAAEAGQKLTAATVLEVQDTFVALLADEAAEEAVLSGALVKPLSYSGFGSVDIEGAVPTLTLVPGAGRPVENSSGANEKGDEPAPADDEDGEGDGPDDAPGDGTGAASAGRESAREQKRAQAREQKRAREREQLLHRIDAAESDLSAAERRLEIVTARHVEVVEGIADLERRLAAARARLEKAEQALERERERVDERREARTAAVTALTAHDEEA